MYIQILNFITQTRMGIPSEIYSLPASTPNLNFFLVYPYYQTFIRGECVLIKQLAKKNNN